MRKNKHPAVLIVEPRGSPDVDEGHELHHKTLTGFKRLMELAAGAGVVLSVLLIGNPKLRNDLRRRQMERSDTAPPHSSSTACLGIGASSSPGS